MRCVAGVLALGLVLVGTPACGRPGGGLWVDRERLANIPAEGPAWEGLRKVAQAEAGTPDLSDKANPVNVRVLAKALVYARTGDPELRQEVVDACRAAIGTEGETTLALGRELAAYVIAADLVVLPGDDDRAFRSWLAEVRHTKLSGRDLISTHERRPNNWGTHAGASRIAIAAYLGDRPELQRAARVFKGWLGDSESYDEFEFRQTWWQADPAEPLGINAAGTRKQGHSIDGVLPDDQRRGGPFEWPPPRENYVYEALQGALAQAVLLHRAGYTDVWDWGDRALLRAFRWLHEEAHFPAEGDDTWQPHLINYYYGTSFPAPVPTRPGKNVGFTGWTHAGSAPALP
jgi:hypothetical protein